MKNPYINAVLAALYIGVVGSLMFYVTHHPGPKDSFLDPIAVISVFTLSAAVMGYLFALRPLQMYIDGQKAESVKFFLKTLGTFAVITIAFLLLVFVI